MFYVSMEQMFIDTFTNTNYAFYSLADHFSKPYVPIDDSKVTVLSDEVNYGIGGDAFSESRNTHYKVEGSNDENVSKKIAEVFIDETEKRVNELMTEQGLSSEEALCRVMNPQNSFTFNLS